MASKYISQINPDTGLSFDYFNQYNEIWFTSDLLTAYAQKEPSRIPKIEEVLKSQIIKSYQKYFADEPEVGKITEKNQAAVQTLDNLAERVNQELATTLLDLSFFNELKEYSLQAAELIYGKDNSCLLKLTHSLDQRIEDLEKTYLKTKA